MKAFLVDDEPLALSRLERLLRADGRVMVTGKFTDPFAALEAVRSQAPDLLFLDIEMPELTGFELLKRLDAQPVVIFTTAYDRYALEAFEANTVDYLLKPIEPARLALALTKIQRLRDLASGERDWREMMSSLSKLADGSKAFPHRVASRTGDKVEFVDLALVTHFFAQDKLTYAAAAGRNYAVDRTIQQLERELDPKRFLRVHRSAVVNLDYVREFHAWFAGRAILRLKDGSKTEIAVARDRVRALKEKLGIA